MTTRLRGLPTEVLAGENRTLDGAVVSAIRAQVADDPDAVAIEHSGESVTYRDLWYRSSRLAVTVDAVCGRDGVMAIWADRTPNVIAAMLACLRVGTAYVPVDPTYPVARVVNILNAARPLALLVDPTGHEVPHGLPVRVVDAVVDTVGTEPVPDRDVPRDAAAYVMFTSGSTGLPKPVGISVAALHNYCGWVNELAPTGCGSPIFGSLAFDHSITLIWPPLMTGKRVVLLAGPWDLKPLLRERPEPFSLVKATPSHLRMFERLARPDYSRIAHVLMFGGEALTGDLVAQLRPRLSGVTLVNHFGPTECTVGCVAHVFDADDVDGSGPVPIGRPLWNTRAYILPVDGSPADAEVGELAIGGVQVCLPAPNDSPERFADESDWGGHLAGRAYRTGDLVSMRGDGVLVFRGRRDDQLKVNGVRLEAQEVRALAIQVPGVSDALAWSSGSPIQRLNVQISAVSLDPNHAELVSAVVARLRAELPPSIPLGDITVGTTTVDAHGKATRPGKEDSW